MIDHDIAAELERLADAIVRMRPPQNSNPHAFHEDKSELASRARQLARRCKTGETLEQASPDPAPIGRQVTRHSVRQIAGRAVVVQSRQGGKTLLMSDNRG